MVSTPTIRGPSRIEREFEASDRRRYFVPCPQCGAMQWLQFERLRWAKGQPETAAYHCEGCEKPISEHHRTQMLERGEWQPTATSVDPHAIGFHIPALYSPLGWKSWVQNARDGLAAQGSDERPRAARNTLLGETWVESGDAPEWRRLADRREVAWSLGADRWDEAPWRPLEGQAGVETKLPALPEIIEPTAPSAGTVLTPRRCRQGAVTPKYMR